MDTAKVLVAGWYSLNGGHATLGDYLSMKIVCDELSAAGISYDVCVSSEMAKKPYLVKLWVTGSVDRSYPPQNELIGDGSSWMLTSTTLITDLLNVGATDVSTARDGLGIPTRADFAFLSKKGKKGEYAVTMLRGAQSEYRMAPDSTDHIRSEVIAALISLDM